MVPTNALLKNALVPVKKRRMYGLKSLAIAFNYHTKLTGQCGKHYYRLNHIVTNSIFWPLTSLSHPCL